MYHLRIISRFVKASIQNEMAFSSNFWISLLNSFLALGTGVLGIYVLFQQVETVEGWDFPSTLAVLGVYLTLGGLRRLFIGPSLDSMAGMDGEVWSGKFDFSLLRPVDIQFQASFRYWQPLAAVDLTIGLSVIGFAVDQLGSTFAFSSLCAFLLSITFGIVIMYSILLGLSGLVFWSPGFLFTWIFDSLFQLARYPVGLYPWWLRMMLTWVIPVGVMTTFPAQALSGSLTIKTLILEILLALILLVGTSLFFRAGIRRYASASS